jgi:hypothetical protein
LLEPAAPKRRARVVAAAAGLIAPWALVPGPATGRRRAHEVIS